MSLLAELEGIAGTAVSHAGPGEELAGVIPAEPRPGRRVYLCAFGAEERSWLAFDAEGLPLTERAVVREAVSIAAVCELAEDSAGGGKLAELRSELAQLRVTEHPEEIEEAEEAGAELARILGSSPRVATPQYLDTLGTAARRLERALGNHPVSPFTEAMKQAPALVAELEHEVLGGYKRTLR